MSSQLVVIKFKQVPRLSKTDPDSYKFKTITADESFANVAQRIHGRALEAEAILCNKSIYNKHCNILNIDNNKRFEAHKRQFLEGSTAATLWDRAVRDRYPNAVQRTNGALNIVYKDLIDLIAVQKNCSNKIRQYISQQLCWANHNQEGATIRPSSFIARVEQLWDAADQMHTTGGAVTSTSLEKAKQIKSMFPENFENYVARTIRADIADDENGGANPLTPQEIGAHFDECWDAEAEAAGKKRDRNGNWCDSNHDGDSDRDRKRSRVNNDNSVSEGDDDDSEYSNHNANYNNQRKCSLRDNKTHNWAECSLNPNNKSSSKFRFRGVNAATSFLERDGNKSKFPWYLHLINNVRKDQGLPPISDPSLGDQANSSNPSQSFHQYAQQTVTPQVQGGSWQWIQASHPQSFYYAPPSVPPPPAFPSQQPTSSSYYQHHGHARPHPPPTAPTGSWQWNPNP